jgi:DNA-binding transcriptional LysR family regulator
LENDLNTPLFLRANRKVVLTTAGAALAATVSTAFGSMAEMIETIRQPVQGDTVTIGATLAFSHFWILPRLAEFRAAHPQVKLRLIADDAHSDLRRDRLDVAIRFSKPPFADARSIASLADEVYPVCSPALLRARGMQAASADLLSLPLIAADTVNPSWLTWRSWGQGLAQGAALGKASDLSQLRFNHYTDTIQAALHGEGVALGWSTLLAGHLDEGRLVRLGVHSVVLQDEYHILIPANREPSPATQIFLNWIAKCFTSA